MIQTIAKPVIDIVSYVRTKPKPKREWRRFAPPLSFWFYVLTCLAMAIKTYSTIAILIFG